MNHYSGIDHYLIRQRNEEIRREVQALRLDRRFLGDRGQTPLARLVAFALRSTLPLLHRVGLAAR